jgi:hypothetical protein
VPEGQNFHPLANFLGISALAKVFLASAWCDLQMGPKILDWLDWKFLEFLPLQNFAKSISAESWCDLQ